MDLPEQNPIKEPPKASSNTPKYILRSKPLKNIPVSAVKRMIKEKNFYERNKNRNGTGIQHKYELKNVGNDWVVTDAATGLMWQQAGSQEKLNYDAAKAYVKELNDQKFAGFNDWRLPTLEETMSLMETEEINDKLYIAKIFDKKQKFIWTTDTHSASRARFVDFYYGYCGRDLVDYDGYYARVVRSLK